MPNNIQRRISVVEQRNIQNSAVLCHKVVQIDPIIFVDLLVHDVDLLIID